MGIYICNQVPNGSLRQSRYEISSHREQRRDKLKHQVVTSEFKFDRLFAVILINQKVID